MTKRGAVFCSFLFFLFVISSLAGAQSTPFLTDEEVRMLANEISGDRAFEHIRALTTHGHRNSGSEGYFRSVQYILQAAEQAGLEDVSFIEQPLQQPAWNARSAELWMLEPFELKLADLGDSAVVLADGSRDADVTAELVWIGDASPQAMEGIDVSGKIVLTNGSAFRAVQRAVWADRAAGVVCFPAASDRSLELPDQVQWTRVPSNAPQGREGSFAFSLSMRQGQMLRRLLERSDQPVMLRARVDTEFSEGPGRTGFVEGWIRGSKYHDQQIVLTAHIQEEQFSANDDSSGCASMLELARTLNKLIAEGKIERPLRDIRFWWTDEIYSEYRYFADFPDEPARMLANINQDMVGASQSIGDRYEQLIYAPHSRTSFLDTLLFSVGTYVIRSNNNYLGAGNLDGGGRATPMFATRGSHDTFRAMFVPYVDSSDHMCFVEGIVGVPGVGLINWDDMYIHSSSDDLFQVDPTQLKRNCFIVGAMTFAMAYADVDDIDTFTTETYAHGQQRLAHDLAVAYRLLRRRDVGWSDALTVIEMGVERELRALESIRVLAAADESAELNVQHFIDELKHMKIVLVNNLRARYQLLYGGEPPQAEDTEQMAEAKTKIPANIGSLDEYFAKRRGARYRGGLDYLMRSEVFNFVDGRRSYYDIWRAVRAEALTEGEWYYGTVSLEDVVGLLDAASAAGALELK